MKIFETSKCSSQILWNSLCKFWNELIPLQILYPSSVSWKINPLYFFSSHNIYFAEKEPIKMKNFETFECSGQNLSNFLCHFASNKSVVLQILHHFSMSWKITPLYFFSSNNYTLLKRSPLKWKFLRLSSTRVKFCQISYANFEMTSWFFYKFYILFQFHERQLLFTFLAQTVYTFLKRSPLKWKFWRLTNAQVKICQTSYVNFETTSRFLSKFCIPLQFHER